MMSPMISLKIKMKNTGKITANRMEKSSHGLVTYVNQTHKISKTTAAISTEKSPFQSTKGDYYGEDGTRHGTVNSNVCKRGWNFRARCKDL